MRTKSILQMLLFGFLSFQLTSAQAAGSSTTVQVAFFQKGNKDTFVKNIKPVFDQNKTCKSCEIVDLTPYKESGDADEGKLSKEIAGVPADYQILFLNWNEKSTEANRELSDALVKKSLQGTLVFFTAGSPLNNEPTISLNKTIAGQVPEAIIVGEMTERERLLPHLFYGPEMLTAVKPPKEFTGQGLAPVFFLSRWVSQWSRQKPSEWVSYLKLRKNKLRKPWLSTEDFFPR